MCECEVFYLTAAEVERHILQIEITGQAKQKSPETILFYTEIKYEIKQSND